MAIINKINVNGTDYNIRGYFYGTCDTAAGTNPKVITCAEFTSDELVAGTLLVVNNSNKNTSTASLQINVNSTGAKYVRKEKNGEVFAITNDAFYAGMIVLVYNGTNWLLISDDRDGNVNFFDGDFGDLVTSANVGIAGGSGINVSLSEDEGDALYTVGHSNSSVTAKTTQGVYPITFDSLGHISGSGTAVSSSVDSVAGWTINRYAACSTGASTAAKTANVTNGTPTLAAGLAVYVKFTNANTANNPTLNINSKGAKNIFYNGAQITTGSEKSLLKGTCLFVYDGTQWHLIPSSAGPSSTVAAHTHPITSTTVATTTPSTNTSGSASGGATTVATGVTGSVANKVLTLSVSTTSVVSASHTHTLGNHTHNYSKPPTATDQNS